MLRIVWAEPVAIVQRRSDTNVEIRERRIFEAAAEFFPQGPVQISALGRYRIRRGNNSPKLTALKLRTVGILGELYYTFRPATGLLVRPKSIDSPAESLKTAKSLFLARKHSQLLKGVEAATLSNMGGEASASRAVPTPLIPGILKRTVVPGPLFRSAQISPP